MEDVRERMIANGYLRGKAEIEARAEEQEKELWREHAEGKSDDRDDGGDGV